MHKRYNKLVLIIYKQAFCHFNEYVNCGMFNKHGFELYETVSIVLGLLGAH